MNNGLGAELQSGVWRRRVTLPGRRAAANESVAEAAGIEARIDPELAERWDELALHVGAAPYLRPGWIAAWWRAFGSGRLEIRTLERDGRLIALMPLARRHGALRSVTNPHTPEFGMIAEDRPAAAALARSLFGTAQARRVTIAALDPDGGELDACRRAAEEKHFRVSVRFYERSPYLRLAGNWEAYSASLGGGFAAGLRRSHRQLERLGAASVEVATSRDRLDDRLGEAFAVESSGWKDARGTAIRAHPQTRAFYTDVARWAVDFGLLRLFFLRLDGRTIATYFALEQDGVLYLLKGGYDPDYARVSPGKLLMHRLIEHAFRVGIHRIEFHGDDDAYKLRWCDTVRERVIFEGFSSSPFGQLDWGVFRYGRPAAKRMLRRNGVVPPRSHFHPTHEPEG